MSNFTIYKPSGNAFGGNAFGFTIEFAPPGGDYQNYFNEVGSVSVGWEIVLGREALSTLLPENLLDEGIETAWSKNQFASPEDFFTKRDSIAPSLSGTAVFSKGVSGAPISFTTHDYGSLSYELSELYGVKFDAPSVSSLVQPEGELLVIKQDANYQRQFLSLDFEGLFFVEGGIAPSIKVSSSYKEDYFKENLVDAYIEVVDRNSYDYAGRNDFSTYSFETKIPILDGASFIINEFLAIADGIPEGIREKGVEYAEIAISFPNNNQLSRASGLVRVYDTRIISSQFIETLDPITGQAIRELARIENVISVVIFQSAPAPSATQADQITTFNAATSVMVLSQEVIPEEQILFKAARNQRQANRELRGRSNIIYNRRTGELIYDANGRQRGWGEGGGILAVLTETPRLTRDNFVLVPPNLLAPPEGLG